MGSIGGVRGTSTQNERLPVRRLISARGVTLDLGGHSIYGDGTGAGIVVLSGGTVQHGRVLGFAGGIHVGNGNGTIEDMTVAHNGVGIYGTSRWGSKLTVRRSLVAANDRDGLRAQSTTAEVTDSRFLRNGDNGVTAYNSDTSRFERNAFTANRHHGLFTFWGTAVIGDNSASRNGLDGIHVEDSIAVYYSYSIVSNQANNNQGLGISFSGKPINPATGNGVDGGGNRATGNHDPRQCVQIACRRR
jgi:hypothetical protein